MTATDTPRDGVTLSVPTDVVCFIIQQAHDLLGKSASSASEDDTSEPDDPEIEVREDRDTDPAEAELRSVIADLPEDAQIDLVALMWLGRDDDDWDTLRALAEQEHNDATADYLCGTPLLADYLEDGMEALGLYCN